MATYETPDWDPHSSVYEEQEQSMTDSHGHVWEHDAIGLRGRRLMSVGMCADKPDDLTLSSVHTGPCELSLSLNANINIMYAHIPAIVEEYLRRKKEKNWK